MRLTTSLLYYVNRRRIPGKITIGKHRRWPTISKQMKFQAAHDLVREDENMAILSRPFLTEEQDKVYLQLQEERWKKQVHEKYRERITSKMPKHYTTLEALSHLNTTKAWM